MGEAPAPIPVGMLRKFSFLNISQLSSMFSPFMASDMAV